MASLDIILILIKGALLTTLDTSSISVVHNVSQIVCNDFRRIRFPVKMSLYIE
ncbi:hypothetical protein VDIAB_110200 [Vibrio diabolicus]|nr:hypothetical protein VDIAB_110200 [Vibrio diabolicus]